MKFWPSRTVPSGIRKICILCTENPALDREFAFAISNHIPVLPLMQESNLEDLFNQKCGNLQFLDKNSFDKLAISYDEKLKKYLSSVLIGDDLVKRICCLHLFKLPEKGQEIRPGADASDPPESLLQGYCHLVR